MSFGRRPLASYPPPSTAELVPRLVRTPFTAGRPQRDPGSGEPDADGSADHDACHTALLIMMLATACIRPHNPLTRHACSAGCLLRRAR